MTAAMHAFHCALHGVRHVGTYALDGDDPGAGRARVAVLHDQEGNRLHLLPSLHKGVVETDFWHPSGFAGHADMGGIVPAARDALLAPDAEG